MTTRARHPLGVPHRLGVVLFSLFFATTLAAAPLTHPASCTGACDPGTAHGVGDGLQDGAPACHGQDDPRAEPGSCTCTDDCCSLLAQFVAAPIVADGAAPAVLVRRALPARPDDAGRAPAPQLLPYPTGPPAAL